MKKYLLVLVFLVFATNTYAKDEVKIKTLIESKSFNFIPQSAFPLSLPMVSLSSSFILTISADTVNSYLPFYGRSRIASFDNESPYAFIDTEFQYVSKETKKGWDITIKSLGKKNDVVMYLYISKSGFATLQVRDNDRDPIYFTGYIE